MDDPTTVSALDDQLMVWRVIYLGCVNEGDLSGEIDALEKIDALLDRRNAAA